MSGSAAGTFPPSAACLLRSALFLAHIQQQATAAASTSWWDTTGTGCDAEVQATPMALVVMQRCRRVLHVFCALPSSEHISNLLQQAKLGETQMAQVVTCDAEGKE